MLWHIVSGWLIIGVITVVMILAFAHDGVR